MPCVLIWHIRCRNQGFRSSSMHIIALWQVRFLAAVLFSVQFSDPSWAEGDASSAPPAGFNTTFQWDYSCQGGVCSFSCPGQIRAIEATKLTIYLGSISVGNVKETPALFYQYSSRAIRRAQGFTISAGLGNLSCQIIGMTLDYSGPPKSVPSK